MISIVQEAIDPTQIFKVMSHPQDGALATFFGVVRDHDHGQKVRYLVYEAYTEMAIKEMQTIAKEVADRWGIDRILMTHRIGRLDIGDIAVAIAVGSSHRKEAFEACQYAINRIKETVPIWKKEYYEDSARWKGAPSPGGG